jgi:hypothetical protein
MRKLIISPNFTINDIHKIREYHYEMTKNMTFKELKKDLQKSVNAFNRDLAKIK